MVSVERRFEIIEKLTTGLEEQAIAWTLASTDKDPFMDSLNEEEKCFAKGFMAGRAFGLEGMSVEVMKSFAGTDLSAMRAAVKENFDRLIDAAPLDLGPGFDHRGN